MERILKRLQPGHNGFQFIVEPQVREELSPIVLFDASMLEQHGNGLQFGMHPHSGIGIITNFEGANLVHDDTGIRYYSLCKGLVYPNNNCAS